MVLLCFAVSSYLPYCRTVAETRCIVLRGGADEPLQQDIASEIIQLHTGKHIKTPPKHINPYAKICFEGSIREGTEKIPSRTF